MGRLFSIAVAGVLITAGGAPVLAQVPAPPSWARCSTCHTSDAGKPSGIGPNLAGIVGRKAGSLPKYGYSPAMKSSGITWTRDKLDAFIARPQAVVPGTKMVVPGLADAKARAELMQYLESLH